jgi:hypothetical protein
MGRSGICGSGEVEGVVDLREEGVLVRGLEECPEADNRSNCFPDEDGDVAEGRLGLRDAIVVERTEAYCWREVTLVSVALEEKPRLVGSAANRVLGRSGDFEAAFVRGLVTLLTSFGRSASVSARKSIPILAVRRLGHTGFPNGLGGSRSA